MISVEELCQQVCPDDSSEVEAVSMVDGTLVVRFSCDLCSDPDVRKSYILRCSDVPEHSLIAGPCEEISVSDDHCLLWTYHCEAAYLHFTSNPSNPFEIVGRLYEAHEELFSGWRPLTGFLNPSLSGGLHGLLERGSGMLAQGPWPVMEAYARAISNKMEVNINSAHDSRYISTRPYKALVIDESYVICREITVSEEA